MSKRKNVLICPLNWGLGHATRCVPIIKEFIDKHANVMIAADKRPLAFLKNEFPDLQFITFPSYEITYQKKGSFAFRMLRILPQLIMNIYKEHKYLNKIIKDYQIDLVISDNRFGLWNRKIKSIFITHQILIKSPFNSSFVDFLLYSINKAFIRNYNECWIPDFEGDANLSGELSHKYKLPIPTYFIGSLTRFEYVDNMIFMEENDVLVILSGPEPQRSMFETLMMKELSSSHLNAVIVRGIPEENDNDFTRCGKLKIYSHLPTMELRNLILKSKMIICRSGYSTIMDIVALGKKAILIPTPGQTEQEYLAKYYMSKKYFFSMAQKNFNLNEAICKSVDYSGIRLQNNQKQLIERIISLLKE